MTYHELRGKLQWPTVASSAILFITDWVVEIFYIGWKPFPHSIAPTWMDMVLAPAAWATVILAIISFPRWHSIIALLALLLVVMAGAGR